MSTPQAVPARVVFGVMRHQVSAFAPVAVRGIIQVLDFEAIKHKLRDSVHGLGWSEEKTERVEKMYRRFLFLQVTSTETIVPTRDIDDFWHAHILDTRKYAADCQTAFGFYLHHYPYFGLRGEEDTKDLETAFERSRTLYENTYGESYATDQSAPRSSSAVTVIDANTEDDDRCSGCG